MVVISKSKILEFIEKHPAAKASLLGWYLKTKEADGKDLTEVKRTFAATDYIGDDLYVFNVE